MLVELAEQVSPSKPNKKRREMLLELPGPIASTFLTQPLLKTYGSDRGAPWVNSFPFHIKCLLKVNGLQVSLLSPFKKPMEMLVELPGPIPSTCPYSMFIKS